MSDKPAIANLVDATGLQDRAVGPSGMTGLAAQRALRCFDIGLRLLLGLHLIGITAIVFAAVVSRYFFNYSFAWSGELASWGLISLTFTAAAAGHVADRHIALDLFGWAAPGGCVASCRAFVVDLVIVITALLLISGGVGIIEQVSGLNAALQWDVRIKYLVVPISTAVSIIVLVLARLSNGSSWIAACGPVLLGGLLCWGAATLDSPLAGASPTLIMVPAFVATLLIGVPIAYSMLFSAFMSGWGGALLPIEGIVNNVVQGTSPFLLLAIPFFLTAGYLMNTGGLSRRIIDFATTLVGHYRGGIAQANVVQSLLLGGVCGSSSADSASTTKILVPEMTRRGYTAEFACAVTSVSAILPSIVPPSIALLIYASVANISVAQLFLAGVVPAVIMCAAMMLMVYLLARRRGYEAPSRRASAGQIARAGLSALPSLGIAIAVIGLLRGGVMTATEVGLIAVVWALVLGGFFYKEFTLASLCRDVIESALDSGLICFLIGVAAPVAWVMIAEQLPQELLQWILASDFEKWLVLLLVNVVSLIAGCVLEIVPSILILAPLLTPVLMAMGVDPIHLGIIVIINLLLATVMPPFGILVFISSSIARVSVGAVFRECVPFVLVCFLTLLIITFFEDVTLGLGYLLNV